MSTKGGAQQAGAHTLPAQPDAIAVGETHKRRRR
jgi:hypothetical protein